MLPLTQALSIITILIKSLNNEASLLLDLLPNDDKFAQARQLQDDLCVSQEGLDQWVHNFLDTRHQHMITVERLIHLNELLCDNQHHLSSGKVELFQCYHIIMVTTLVLKGSTLLKLVQCLVSVCSGGNSNALITREAFQCLGLIGVRDFGSVSLLPSNLLGICDTCIHTKVNCACNFASFLLTVFSFLSHIPC